MGIKVSKQQVENRQNELKKIDSQYALKANQRETDAQQKIKTSKQPHTHITQK